MSTAILRISGFSRYGNTGTFNELESKVVLTLVHITIVQCGINQCHQSIVGGFVLVIGHFMAPVGVSMIMA